MRQQARRPDCSLSTDGARLSAVQSAHQVADDDLGERQQSAGADSLDRMADDALH
jgi:hypothetical protein